MSRFKFEARASAPGVAVPMSAAKVEPYGRGPEAHPLIRFQPTKRAVVPKSDMSASDVRKIEAWWSTLLKEIGSSPWVMRDSPFIKHPTQGTVIIWTFSGDLDVQDMSIPQFGDDCE